MTETDDPIEANDPLTTNQFKPGKSGNPLGRPRGAKGMKTIVQVIAHETHVVTEDGAKKRLSTIDLVVKMIQRKALEGNLPAQRYLDQLREKYSVQEVNDKGYGYLVVPEAPKSIEGLGFPIEDVEEFN